MAGAVFDRVLDVAADHHGLVAVAEARRHGIDPAHLRVMAHRGRLERVRRGLYRVPQFPPHPATHIHEAVLAVGHDGAASHASALELRGLAGDLNPSRVTITVPTDARIRQQLPRTYRVVVAALAPGDVELVDGISATTVLRTLRDVIDDGTDPTIVNSIIDAARAEGYISAPDADALGQMNGRR